MARTANGVREVLVLKPPGEESLPAARLQVLQAVAQAAGWRVQQVREPSGPRGRNLAWLAGYPFPTGDEDGQGRTLLEAFRKPTGLRPGVAASGLPALTGLDCAYHMLWQRRLLFDTCQPLPPDTVAHQFEAAPSRLTNPSTPRGDGQWRCLCWLSFCGRGLLLGW
ncbi:hypothetical protein [Streptomyces luteireticuli]|uniref:hypothetical protein n=1 Tax=Streptomyces luteireticuli TaxID=173858 RepID=UPI003556636E